jgi:predicted glycoside hydrolase/deacetylase ChbG (UPF0249 family)
MNNRAQRVLIPHIDDVGMCHGANRACLELMGQGFVTTASVMVPCPWFREIAEAAVARPALDLGVHLTLTSEWPHYRWGPISTASRASGLIDDDGYFWRDTRLARAHLVPEAAEAEMRAQIERALAAGIDATHLDTHMGAAATPELVDIYTRLGREYRLPVLLPRDMRGYLDVLGMSRVEEAAYAAALHGLDAAGGQFIDQFRITAQVPPAESDAAYRAIVRELPPGVTFFSLHCNLPGEIEVISPSWAVWRIEECRIAADPGFHAFVAGQEVELAGFRHLRERYRRNLAGAASSPPDA